MLTVLTIVVATGVVLLVAGYLVAIAWALIQARRNVAELATALELVADATADLQRVVEETDDAVKAIVEVVPTLEAEAARIATPADRHVLAAEV